MGLFNGKEVVELAVKTNENTNDIMAIKRDFEVSIYNFENYKIENDEKMKLILDEVLEIKKAYGVISDEKDIAINRCKVLENEKAEIRKELEEAIALNQTKGEYLTFDDVVKQANIKNLNTAKLKYYLFKKGVMNMKINKNRNSFVLNEFSLNAITNDLSVHLVCKNKGLLFKKTFMDYISSNHDEILSKAQDYQNKQDQYELSSKKLASTNIKNYKEEIKLICGTDDNIKWNAIYKEFSMKYKTFYSDYEKYIAEHHVDGRYDISRVAYVVSIMGEGNYLLKIACDLYA